MRHVKVRSVEDIDEKAFRALALQAEKVTLPIPRKSSAGARTKSIKKKGKKTSAKIRKKAARRA